MWIVETDELRRDAEATELSSTPPRSEMQQD